MQKIKENFISFRDMLLQNKKRVNWSNNLVKTKNLQFLLKWELLALF
jgi:hypothetical protein